MKLVAVVIASSILSWCVYVLPINVAMVSSPAEAAAKQVVWLRCSLQPGELALFHKGLAVHTDNPALRIASWQVDAMPALLPPQIFNRVRRAYTETVFLALTVQSSLEGAALQEALVNATFYVAGLVLKRSLSQHWRICPVLAMGLMAQKNSDTGTAGGVKLSPPLGTDVLNTIPAVLWRTTNPLNEEFTWLDAFADVWKQLLLFGTWLNNIYLLLFFFYLMAGCFLKRYTPLPLALVPCHGLALQWFSMFAVVGFSILFLCQVLPWLGLPVVCVLMAVLFFVGEAYTFIFQPTEKLLLGRMTGLVGWLMGVCVLPCLVKAILTWYGW